MKRFLALALALTMLGTLAGCGSGFDGGKIKEGVCYEATGIAPDATVMKVDGIEVPMDMYFYNLCYAASYMDNFMSMYGMTFDWSMDLGDGTTVLDAVRDSAMSNTRNFAVIEKMAQENDVILDEDALATIATQRRQIVENLGGEENYQKELDKLGLREETFDRMSRSDGLYDALEELSKTEGSSLYATDAELLARAKDQGYMTADHILLMTIDPTTYQQLDDDAVAEKKALAEEIKAKLDAYEGDDLEGYFTELADEYSEDSGRASNPAGYTFGSGKMVEEFENAAAALGENEVSDIVESSYGYHIILRKPLDEESAVSTMRENYFSDLVAERQDNAEVEVDPKLEELDLKAVYEAFLSASAALEESADAQTGTNGAGTDETENPSENDAENSEGN